MKEINYPVEPAFILLFLRSMHQLVLTGESLFDAGKQRAPLWRKQKGIRFANFERTQTRIDYWLNIAVKYEETDASKPIRRFHLLSYRKNVMPMRT